MRIDADMIVENSLPTALDPGLVADVDPDVIAQTLADLDDPNATHYEAEWWDAYAGQQAQATDEADGL